MLRSTIIAKEMAMFFMQAKVESALGDSVGRGYTGEGSKRIYLFFFALIVVL